MASREWEKCGQKEKECLDEKVGRMILTSGVS